MIKYLQTSSVALRIDGPDANTFLQGQFSQNVRLILGGISYGLWLNQKGRPVADSFVVRLSEDEHWVFNFRVEASVVRERLEAYLIADDVQITDASDSWVVFALWGDALPTIIQRMGWTAPLLGKVALIEGAFVFAARFTSGANVAIVCRKEAAGELARRLAEAGARPASVADLELERIGSGIPAVPDDIGTNELPNEGGLDAVAISYTKGCFLGQEVMARLKNLGQVRRRLFRIRGAGAAPATRTELFQGDKRVGDTRTAAADGSGFTAMAMLSLINFAKEQSTRLADGRVVEIEEI